MRFNRLFSAKCIGQPAHWTHPHLINKGEITPGITLQEFKQRRTRFLDLLPDQCTCIIPGYGLRYMV